MGLGRQNEPRLPAACAIRAFPLAVFEAASKHAVGFFFAFLALHSPGVKIKECEELLRKHNEAEARVALRVVLLFRVSSPFLDQALKRKQEQDMQRSKLLNAEPCTFENQVSERGFPMLTEEA